MQSVVSILVWRPFSVSMPALNQKNPQPWTLFFHAKYKSFRLKFRIPHNLLPASSHGQFSFILKFHHCRLKLKSVTTTNRHFLKSKLFGILRKMTPPKPKYPKNLIIPKVHRVQNKQCKSEVPVFSFSSLIWEIFTPQGTQKGVFLYIVNLLFDRILSQKLNKFLLFLIVSLLCFWQLCYFNDWFLSIVWWVWSASSYVGLNRIWQGVLSEILGRMGLIEEPMLQFL